MRAIGVAAGTLAIALAGLQAGCTPEPSTLDQIETELVRMHKANPELVVFIRADKLGYNKDTYAIIDRCQRNGITRFSLRTEPANQRR